MLFITDDSTNPYRNLAIEEYLLKNFREPIFRLWRNNNAIIVGRYQNTLAEINYNYVKENNVGVVRRLTGGGAVFHDLGNLNYTFINAKKKNEDSVQMFKNFTRPIIDALNSLGAEAYLEGRNDILIDGKKISGTAICIDKDRILQHGTLLFESSLDNLSLALKSRPEKFEGKSVKSNRKRVTNIKEHLKGIDNQVDALWLRDYLKEWILSREKEVVEYRFSENEKKEIDELTQNKYSTHEWNFGESPTYSLSNIKKFDGGLLEFYFTVNKGIIDRLNICGDYFFSLPTEDFIKQIVGTSHQKDELSKKISTLDTGAYFNNIAKEEILQMFF